MSKIIVSKSDISKTNENMLLSIEKLMNFCLFLYLCATSAHQSGEGFDALFIRITFVLYVGSVALSFLISKERLTINYYILWLFVFFAYCYLSYMWARNQSDAMLYSNTFIQIFAVALGLSQQLKSNEDINKLFKLIHLSFLYLGVYILIVTPAEEFGTERIGNATGLHANDIGFRLAVGVLISVYFFTTVKNLKWFYMISAIGLSILVLLTGSRKSIGMILLCVSAYIILYKQRRKVTRQNLKEDLTKKIVLILVIAIPLIVLWYVMMNVEFFYNVIGFRFESMLNTFIGTEADSSMNERAFFAEKAMELFKQHPILGYGCNNFAQYMREIGSSHIAYSHNNLLELLSTLGVVGTAIYYVPLISFAFGLLKCYLKNKQQLGLVLVVFMIFTFVTTSYSMYYCMEMYYPFFISAFMYYKFNKDNKEIKSETIFEDNKES